MHCLSEVLKSTFVLIHTHIHAYTQLCIYIYIHAYMPSIDKHIHTYIHITTSSLSSSSSPSPSRNSTSATMQFCSVPRIFPQNLTFITGWVSVNRLSASQMRTISSRLRPMPACSKQQHSSRRLGSGESVSSSSTSTSPSSPSPFWNQPVNLRS